MRRKIQKQTKSGKEQFVIYFLIAIVLLLQYPLWLGSGSVVRVWQLKQQIERQQKDNETLQQRNRQLEAEVRDLKKGLAAIEERARTELGMIKKGETFYRVIDPDKDAANQKKLR